MQIPILPIQAQTCFRLNSVMGMCRTRPKHLSLSQLSLTLRSPRPLPPPRTLSTSASRGEGLIDSCQEQVLCQCDRMRSMHSNASASRARGTSGFLGGTFRLKLVQDGGARSVSQWSLSIRMNLLVVPKYKQKLGSAKRSCRLMLWRRGSEVQKKKLCLFQSSDPNETTRPTTKREILCLCSLTKHTH